MVHRVAWIRWWVKTFQFHTIATVRLDSRAHPPACSAENAQRQQVTRSQHLDPMKPLHRPLALEHNSFNTVVLVYTRRPKPAGRLRQGCLGLWKGALQTSRPLKV